MNAAFTVGHHQAIAAALSLFNTRYFLEHDILFGGGTRIALELDEYRQSIDIDFLCPHKQAYRAVREQVTNVSLGKLVRQDFTYLREIRSDRDAVRTFIEHQGVRIKLEFVSFDNYALEKTMLPLFPVPCISRTSCYYTKLLANADRALAPPYKDIFDLLAMFRAWGNIPAQAMLLAEEHYGGVVRKMLIKALDDVIAHPRRYLASARDLQMKPEWATDIVTYQAGRLLMMLTPETSFGR